MQAAGFFGAKVKIGKPRLSEYDARPAAVRVAVGDRFHLFVDANQGFTLHQAMMWADMLAGHRVGWFAQALPADDAGVHAQLARHSRVPVAVGESLYSASQFKHYMLQGAPQIVQVDAARIGGITHWLKVAHMAEAFNLSVCPHFLMELHVSLVTAVPNGWMLEYVPQLDAITTSRLDLREGRAYPSEGPGLGIEWDWAAIRAQTVEGSHSMVGGD